ncbi:proline--tRNA ligase [Deinococcus cavernae]|uniref:Proline--tRNA ligase n=1 Tax=Deinococcus cavernae TaxID=2320857 RepID=A0A418V927_9DEIO|nr:proline--tRNA ligase [Deinococcus cavernae]RJF72618.1 proline--tRNA ligase [Deinococcus cavernae]
MRLSQVLFSTRREAPADAETRGTQLLVRAGFVRKVGSGLYANLPMMQRVLNKLEGLIRSEVDGLSQEVSLPVLQPEALWRESGRWEALALAEGIMFTVADRAGRAHALAPTHEEVAVDVVRGLVHSYRDLPVSVYQFGRKFRDELRPRFGLLRTREFVMKDAYSFHADEADLHAHFEAMSAAYARILTRLNLQWRAVEADSGSIGGSASREFMVLADVGEDEILFTPDGEYAANVERAVSLAEAAPASPFQLFQRHHTPGTATVASACAALGCKAAHMVKNVLYDAVTSDGVLTPVLVSLRGDHAVNGVKLWNAVQDRLAGPLVSLEVAQAEQWATGELTLGFIGPDVPDSVIVERSGLHPHFLRLCDVEAARMQDFATGANETDYHVTGANWGVDFRLPEVMDVRQAQAGERAVHDAAQRLHSARGIEMGHVFKLGTRYSAAMNATFTDANNLDRPFQMGCYGLGVTRLAQAVAEQLADERGLNWPASIVPFDVMLTVVDTQHPAQRRVAEQLYAELRQAGLEVLLDDRPERAGAKFADAELTGIPYRVTIGRGAEQDDVEVTHRRSGERVTLPSTSVRAFLQK